MLDRGRKKERRKEKEYLRSNYAHTKTIIWFAPYVRSKGVRVGEGEGEGGRGGGRGKS